MGGAEVDGVAGQVIFRCEFGGRKVGYFSGNDEGIGGDE